MSDYTDTMHDLNAKMYDALRACLAAMKAADNEDGAPKSDIENLYHDLRHHCADVDSLIDNGMTVKDMRSARALYEGAKVAGLVR